MTCQLLINHDHDSWSMLVALCSIGVRLGGSWHRARAPSSPSVHVIRSSPLQAANRTGSSRHTVGVTGELVSCSSIHSSRSLASRLSRSSCSHDFDAKSLLHSTAAFWTHVEVLEMYSYNTHVSILEQRSSRNTFWPRYGRSSCVIPSKPLYLLLCTSSRLLTS